MELGKHDPVTGRMTTGHEWNGIEELQTPIPIVVFLFLATTILFAVICWLLYPTFPLGWTYTKGILGTDLRQVAEQGVLDNQAQRAGWTGQIEGLLRIAGPRARAFMPGTRPRASRTAAMTCRSQ